MVHDRLLDREQSSQFRTLILPNIAALSTEQCKQIRDFVERGGSIIATYETSLYDEWGVQRKDFGLASLFGASYRRQQGRPDAQLVPLRWKRIRQPANIIRCWPDLKMRAESSTAFTGFM